MIHHPAPVGLSVHRPQAIITTVALFAKWSCQLLRTKKRRGGPRASPLPATTPLPTCRVPLLRSTATTLKVHKAGVFLETLTLMLITTHVRKDINRRW